MFHPQIETPNRKAFDMLKALGFVWGVLFLMGGIFGFVPGITEHDMMLGIFVVNTAHSIVHVASGAMFLIASWTGEKAARLWFKTFGFVYAAMAADGFMVGDGMICGMISNNQYDSWGHAALALVLLLIGFAAPKQTALVNVVPR